MYIPKCQGVFNRTVLNLLFNLIYFLFNKVFKTWKNCETPYITFWYAVCSHKYKLQSNSMNILLALYFSSRASNQLHFLKIAFDQWKFLCLGFSKSPWLVEISKILSQNTQLNCLATLNQSRFHSNKVDPELPSSKAG